MNKEQLVQRVAKKTRLSQKHVDYILSTAMDVIRRTVARNRKVTLVGFGTFQSRKRASRVGRNPKTGQTLDIPAKKVPVFSAGKHFKQLVGKSK
jgi:DNA-binding protein HU-beta